MSNNHTANRSFTNLVLDIALIAGFVVSFRPFLTGLAVHEWLGLVIGAGLGVHLVRRWRWVRSVTKRFFGKLPLKTRVYYTLDAGLLVSFLAIMGSGVAMSGAVLPALGLSGSTSYSWVVIHKLASYLTLFLFAVKLVLHRAWFAKVVNRVWGRKSRQTPAEPPGLAYGRAAVSDGRGQ